MKQIARYNKAFNALVLRQRLLLVLASVALCYMVWYFAWGHSVEQHVKSLRLDNDYMHNQLVDENDTASEFQAVDAELQTLKQTLANIQRQEKQLVQELAGYGSVLVTADELVAIVKILIAAHDRLVLDHVAELPVEKIELQSLFGNEAQGQEDEESLTAVYKHPILLQLRGDYLSVAQYVRQIEAHEKRLFFETLTYEVADYPEAVVSLLVYTLSMS